MVSTGSTALAWKRVVGGSQGSVGVFVKLQGDAGLGGLQRVGESIAAEHAAKGAPETWVWVWGWDMDTEGPAACLSYARPDLKPITEWTDPSRVAAWYVLRRQDHPTVN